MRSENEVTPRVLSATISPDTVYITVDEEPYINEKLVLTVKVWPYSPITGLRAVSSGVSSNESKPRLYVHCDWDNPNESLCTLEEAKNISVTAEYGCNWKTSWVKEYECWLLEATTASKLPDTFTLNFAFESVVTHYGQGPAFLYVAPMYIPGLPEGAMYPVGVTRRFPIQATLSANPLFVVKNETTRLTWTTMNADRCYINGEMVNLSGSRDYTISAKTRFIMMAENVVGKSESKPVDVGLTNWKHLGALAKGQLPFEADVSNYNYRVFSKNGELYLYMDKSIYKSADEGISWSKFTTAEYAELGSIGNHTTLLHNDYFYILGGYSIYVYSFTDNSWGRIDDNQIRGICAICATVKEGIAIAASDVTSTMIGFFTSEPGKKWMIAHSFKISKVTSLVTEIESMDMATCAGSLYIAVRDKSTMDIHIFATDNFTSFKRVASPNVKISGWYRLTPCGDTLLLLYDKGILAPLNSALEFPNFLPQLYTEKEKKPWIGTSAGRIYVLAPGASDPPGETDVWGFGM